MSTNLPPEDVVIALETNAQRAYTEVMRNFARLNLVHLAIVAKRIDENARYILLDDSDQTVGDYVIVGLNSDDDELRDHGMDFQDVPMNLCASNEATWLEFLDRSMQDEFGHPPYYLDIDKIIEAYPTWELAPAQEEPVEGDPCPHPECILPLLWDAGERMLYCADDWKHG